MLQKRLLIRRCSQNETNSPLIKKDEDYIRDPKTGKSHHPGVTLAVGKLFERVGVGEGFWAVRKTAAGWQPVELPKFQGLKIPSHLQVSLIQVTVGLTEYLKSLAAI